MAEIENKEELLKVFAQSKSSEAVTQWFSSSELSMTDKDGIVTRVRVGELEVFTFKISAPFDKGLY